MAEPRWTLSILTIPQREAYAQQLIDSLASSGATRRARVSIVYNWDSPEPPVDIERRIRRFCRGLSLEVAFNTTDPCIGAGRQQQLNACKTPCICFLDDDVTVHGDLIGTLERGLARQPLGIVGVPSLVEDTSDRFKPRDDTPSVVHEGIRFMTVQGMAIGGYRRLFLDVGGFNPRRRFWGEWTELNLRLWRSGFPTGYVMDGAWLRHWHDAPESPTRNRSGRELDVLWGLMCTALEYDAVDVTEKTGSFWQLVAQRYLPYAFGPAAGHDTLLSACLRLAPRVAAEWPAIAEFRERTRGHPFAFAPFHTFTAGDVHTVLSHATDRIAAYRDTPATTPWLQRQLRRWLPTPARMRTA